MLLFICSILLTCKEAKRFTLTLSLSDSNSVNLCSVQLELRPLNAPLSLCVPWLAPHEGQSGAARVLPALNHHCLPVRRNYNYTELESLLRQTAVFLCFFSLHPSLTHIHTLRVHQVNCNCLYWLQLSPELHGMNHSSTPLWQAFALWWSFTSEKRSAGIAWASSQLWPSNM